MSLNERGCRFPENVYYIIIGALAGSIMYTGGALLLRVDSRVSCLAGLAVALPAPVVIFSIVSLQASNETRKVLLSCAFLLMPIVPLMSWMPAMIPASIGGEKTWFYVLMLLSPFLNFVIAAGCLWCCWNVLARCGFQIPWKPAWSTGGPLIVVGAAVCGLILFLADCDSFLGTALTLLLGFLVISYCLVCFSRKLFKLMVAHIRTGKVGPQFLERRKRLAVPHKVLVIAGVLLLVCDAATYRFITFREPYRRVALFNSLSESVEAGDLERIKVLVRRAGGPNARDPWGIPLLCYAVKGETDTVRFLLNEGAEINAKDNHGFTALHATVLGGKKDIVELLLTRGADVNARDKYGFTPLHYANSTQYFKDIKDIAELLIQKGSDINAKTEKGWTPLHKAVRARSPEVVQLLIDKGADVNAKDYRLHTPLHFASANGDAKLVWLLIEKGADLNTKDLLGRTPVDLAQDNGLKKITDLLRQHGGKSGKELK